MTLGGTRANYFRICSLDTFIILGNRVVRLLWRNTEDRAARKARAGTSSAGASEGERDMGWKGDQKDVQTGTLGDNICK